MLKSNWNFIQKLSVALHNFITTGKQRWHLAIGWEYFVILRCLIFCEIMFYCQVLLNCNTLPSQLDNKLLRYFFGEEIKQFWSWVNILLEHVWNVFFFNFPLGEFMQVNEIIFSKTLHGCGFFYFVSIPNIIFYFSEYILVSTQLLYNLMQFFL